MLSVKQQYNFQTSCIVFAHIICLLYFPNLVFTYAWNFFRFRASEFEDMTVFQWPVPPLQNQMQQLPNMMNLKTIHLDHEVIEANDQYPQFPWMIKLLYLCSVVIKIHINILSYFSWTEFLFLICSFCFLYSHTCYLSHYLMYTHPLMYHSR